MRRGKAQDRLTAPTNARCVNESNSFTPHRDGFSPQWDARIPEQTDKRYMDITVGSDDSLNAYTYCKNLQLRYDALDADLNQDHWKVMQLGIVQQQLTQVLFLIQPHMHAARCWLSKAMRHRYSPKCTPAKMLDDKDATHEQTDR